MPTHKGPRRAPSGSPTPQASPAQASPDGPTRKPGRPALATAPPGSVGARLRTARLRSGLSLDQLARAVQSTRQAISKIECADRQPTLEWLYVVAVAIRIKPSVLDDRLTDRLPE